MKAVIFVDVQKDFIDGALPVDTDKTITERIRKYAYICKCEHIPLLATRDTHEENYLETFEGKKLPVEHCIEGTPGWMIDDRLMDAFFAGFAKDETGAEDKEHPVYNCTFVNKPTFGSFDLAAIINEDFFETYQYAEDFRCPIKCLPRVEDEKLDEIVLLGFCTDVCVVSNALLLRAKFPNVRISVIGSLCAGTSADNHKAALNVMQTCQIDVIR